MHNEIAHHPLTNARLPFPKLDQPLFQIIPPSLYTWHGIPFIWSVQVTCLPAVFPPNFFCAPPPW